MFFTSAGYIGVEYTHRTMTTTSLPPYHRISQTHTQSHITQKNRLNKRKYGNELVKCTFIQNRDDETIEKLFFDVMMRRLNNDKRYYTYIGLGLGTHLCVLKF